MRPAGRYNPTSYRDSRPGRHATRSAVLADALADYDPDDAVAEMRRIADGFEGADPTAVEEFIPDPDAEPPF